MRWRGGGSCEKGCKGQGIDVAVGLGEGSAVGKTSRRKRIKGTSCVRGPLRLNDRSGGKDEGARQGSC